MVFARLFKIYWRLLPDSSFLWLNLEKALLFCTRQFVLQNHAQQTVFHFTTIAIALLFAAGCTREPPDTTPTLNWYVFDEPSGAFVEAARSCSQESGGRYTIDLVPLPADADQQREQLVRRLAAHDSAIDIIGMDVIWTAEFAAAGWILPWPADLAEQVTQRTTGQCGGERNLCQSNPGRTLYHQYPAALVPNRSDCIPAQDLGGNDPTG